MSNNKLKIRKIRMICLIAILTFLMFFFLQDSNAAKEENYQVFPVFDYFVMSFCPYSNQVEGIIAELYSDFKEKVIFKPRYVIYEDYGNPLSGCVYNQNNSYCSMHGLNELYQNVREVCVREMYGLKKYYKFVNKINERCNVQNVETCWGKVGKNIGINIKKIAQCTEDNKFGILAEELSMTNDFSVYGSPTFFINGNEYSGLRTKEALKQVLCDTFEKKPGICKSNLSGKK